MSQTGERGASDRSIAPVLGERFSFEPLDRFRARSVVLERMFGTRPSPRKIGRFVLKGRIDSGSMSTVYLADDPTLRREVALKIISDPAFEAQSRHARVVEEARALAKLAHPNIVKVFGVSAVEKRTLMVMEYIQGENLRGWLDARQPTANEIVDTMIEAGRGLAAAHNAGVVHRDIKPENILCAADGRVVLVDFGLAAALPRPGDALPRSRAVAGSPAYLAAPQFHGEPADAASDQFAYCVTMYEALVGKRPYADPVDGRALASREVLPPAPRDLPLWIWSVLERGLQPRATERHRSMTELIESLMESRRTHRRRFRGSALILGAVALGAGAVAGSSQQDVVAPCRETPPELQRAWGPQTREGLRDAFSERGDLAVQDAASDVAAVFDRYAEQWTATRREVCEAGASGELAAADVDATMHCLGRGRVELAALVRVLTNAERDTLRDAPLAARRLSAPVSCRDARNLRVLTASTADAVSEARAHEAAGLYEAGIASLEPRARRRLSTLDRAAIAYQLGVLYDRSGQPDAAEVWLERALWDAITTRDDDLALRAATSLTHVVGFALADERGGRRWAQHAQSALGREGESDASAADVEVAVGLLEFGAGRFTEARVRFESALALHVRAGTGSLEIADVRTRLGNIALEQGRADESARQHQHALELRRGELGEIHPVIGESLANLANARLDQGDVERGRSTMLRALEVLSGSLGPTHPIVAIVENNLGNLEADVGNDEAALEHYARGLEVSKTALGDDHPQVATILDNGATVLRRLGRIEDARTQLEAALSIRERKLGPEHPDVGYSCTNLGNLEAEVGDTARALVLQRRALAIARTAHGDEHPNVASALGNLGAVHLQVGDAEQSLHRYNEALEIFGRTLEPESPRWVDHLRGRAEAVLQLGDAEAARRDLARALKILMKRGGPSVVADELRALLAKTRRRPPPPAEGSLSNPNRNAIDRRQ